MRAVALRSAVAASHSAHWETLLRVSVAVVRVVVADSRTHSTRVRASHLLRLIYFIALPPFWPDYPCCSVQLICVT